MAAIKGNKYNMRGDEPMDSNLHCRITSTDKKSMQKQAKKDGYENFCKWQYDTLMDRVGK